MHRRPLKRGLSPVRTRSQTKRMRLAESEQQQQWERVREQADLDRAVYRIRRNDMIDNKDRGMITETVKEPDLFRLTGNRVPYNIAGRLDQMRLTGNQRTARSIRNDYHPVQNKLFDNDIFDPDRGVYVCPNCRKFTSPSQMHTWFNPGYRLGDLTITSPLMDTTGPWRGMYRIPGATTPVDRTPVTRVLDLFGNTDGQMVVAPRPEARIPVVFACSRECANEQAIHNRARQERWDDLKIAIDATDSTFPQRNHDWVSLLHDTSPDSRFPYPHVGLLEEYDPLWNRFYFASQY